MDILLVGMDILEMYLLFKELILQTILQQHQIKVIYLIGLKMLLEVVIRLMDIHLVVHILVPVPLVVLIVLIMRMILQQQQQQVTCLKLLHLLHAWELVILDILEESIIVHRHRISVE